MRSEKKTLIPDTCQFVPDVNLAVPGINVQPE